jgi:hypothetical protein
MPESWQRQRIRELTRTLTPETVGAITRCSRRDILAIIEDKS